MNNQYPQLIAAKLHQMRHRTRLEIRELLIASDILAGLADDLGDTIKDLDPSTRHPHPLVEITIKGQEESINKVLLRLIATNLKRHGINIACCDGEDCDDTPGKKEASQIMLSNCLGNNPVLLMTHPID